MFRAKLGRTQIVNAHVYRMTSDERWAPCNQDGLLSLAICMYCIRVSAKLGDLIIAIVGGTGVPGIPARIAWAGIVEKIEPNYQGNTAGAYVGSKYTSRLDNLYIRDAANQLVHKGGDCTIHNTTADDKRRQTDDKRGPTLFFSWDYFRADSMGNGNRPFPSDWSGKIKIPGVDTSGYRAPARSPISEQQRDNFMSAVNRFAKAAPSNAPDIVSSSDDDEEPMSYEARQKRIEELEAELAKREMRELKRKADDDAAEDAVTEQSGTQRSADVKSKGQRKRARAQAAKAAAKEHQEREMRELIARCEEAEAEISNGMRFVVGSMQLADADDATKATVDGILDSQGFGSVSKILDTGISELHKATTLYLLKRSQDGSDEVIGVRTAVMRKDLILLENMVLIQSCQGLGFSSIFTKLMVANMYGTVCLFTDTETNKRASTRHGFITPSRTKTKEITKHLTNATGLPYDKVNIPLYTLTLERGAETLPRGFL